MNLEVLLLVVLGEGLLPRSQLLLLELSREEAVVPGTGPACVRSGVILQELCLSQISHEGARLATPNLASGNQGTSRDDRVRLNHASTLQSSALLNDRPSSDNAVVIDDAGVKVAICLDTDILANVDRAGNSVRQSVSRVYRGTISD